MIKGWRLIWTLKNTNKEFLNGMELGRGLWEKIMCTMAWKWKFTSTIRHKEEKLDWSQILMWEKQCNIRRDRMETFWGNYSFPHLLPLCAWYCESVRRGSYGWGGVEKYWDCRFQGWHVSFKKKINSSFCNQNVFIIYGCVR